MVERSQEFLSRVLSTRDHNILTPAAPSETLKAMNSSTFSRGRVPVKMRSENRGEDEATTPVPRSVRLRPPRRRQQQGPNQTAVSLAGNKPHAWPPFSPSLQPHKCATAPEVCTWASRPDIIQEHASLLRKMRRDDKGLRKSEHARKFACINRAYSHGWYKVPAAYEVQMPPGATGKKKVGLKLQRGSKGLKYRWERNVPKDEDLFVPKGVSRRLIDRPVRGKWYYPAPSLLSREYRPQ
ncbi:uncharacterized protein IWZ02DRAFT_431186 [Phyllosticta citriasiana]|uniref:uncharacterized protein n=1 Tax=Phyllosticta citriasiana TaxID=595635 RepID=UPI0030FDAF77